MSRATRLNKVIRQTELDVTNARLTAVETTSVGLDEIETGRVLATMTATTTVPLSVANLVQRIGALTLLSSTAITQSDTNYWTVTLQRLRATAWVDIVSRTTRAADGAALGADTPWNFDLSAWSSSIRYLNKGDGLRLKFVATGAPDPWTTPVVTWRYEPGVVPVTVVVASDTFTRADSNTAVGVATTGQTWVTTGGTGGIASNQGRAISGGNVASVLPCGIFDGTITLTESVRGTSLNLIVRATDQNNHIFLDGSLNLYRRTAGSSTLIGSFGGAALADGDTVALTMVGNQYTLKVNGVIRGGTLTDSSSSWVTVTGHGFYSAASTGSRVDNFIAEGVL